jgi:hypothetical protein
MISAHFDFWTTLQNLGTFDQPELELLHVPKATVIILFEGITGHVNSCKMTTLKSLRDALLTEGMYLAESFHVYTKDLVFSFILKPFLT